MGVERVVVIEGDVVRSRSVFEVSDLKWLQGKFLDAHTELQDSIKALYNYF